MMGGSFGHPPLQECLNVGLEESSCVGIACRWNRPSHAFALSNDELEPACVGHTNSQHCDGSFLDLKFHACSRPWLAVILCQAAQYRAAIRDVQMMRPIVPYQHKSFLKVDRMELSKAAADLQTI